jgi:hypothetical protein
VRAFLRHPLLVALVAVGVASSAAVAWQRHQLESGYRTVEVVADSEDWRILAQREGVPAGALWEALRRRGVGSVAVYEATLRRLQEEGRLTYRSGAELRDLLRTGALSPRLHPVAASAEPGAVYVMPADPEVAQQVEFGLRTALGPDRVAVVRSDPLVLRVRGRLRDLEETGLGFLPSSVRRWEAMGFRVVLRPRNVRSFTRDRLEERIKGYGELLRSRLVVFDLNEVLGYERLVEVAGRSLKALGAVYGRVEVLVPARRMRGEEAMTRWMRPQVVRVVSIPPEELEKLAPDDAVERFARGVRERNLRVVYLRPYLQTPGGVDALEANLDYAARVAAAVRSAGFQLGPAGPLPELPTSPLRWGALVAAVGSAALLGAVAADVLGRPLPPRVPLLWVVAGLSASLAGQATGLGDWVDKLGALAAAVAFPVLGLAHVSPRAGSGAGLAAALGGLWSASAVSAAGGLVVAALLADWPYRLAADGFFGVKLATVAPAVLVGALWMAREHRPQEAVRQVGRWLSRPVTLGSALAVAAVAAAGLLLLVRTGNTGLPMPALEERLRDALERALVARPRTKEYLLGHPSVVLALACGALGLRRYALPLLVVGAVGQAGLVNSFSHLHTPLLYTVWRTANGLVLGSFVGALLFAAVRLARRAAAAPGPPRVPAAVGTPHAKARPYR